jgi:hypothetical protein
MEYIILNISLAVNNNIKIDKLIDKIKHSDINNFKIKMIHDNRHSFTVKINKKLQIVNEPKGEMDPFKKNIFNQMKFASQVEERLISLSGKLIITSNKIILEFTINQDHYFNTLKQWLLYYVIELFQWLLCKNISLNEIDIKEE